MIVQLRLRRADSAEWTSIDPILEDGEPGWEYDTNRLKIGDGATRWSGLGYATYPATEYDQMISDLTQDISGIDAAVATTTENALSASTDALTASTSAADAEAAATEAKAIGATNDTQTASFVNDPVSATTAALIAHYKTAVNVADFAAKGDGTTDDRKAIQDAMDAVSAAGGGAVTLSSGKTYPCATPLVARDNVDLHLPMGSKILRTTSHAGAFITNASLSTKVTNFSITGQGSIVGASLSISAAQVICLYGDNLRLDDFTIDTYMGGQAVLIGGDHNRMDRVTIRNTQPVAGTGGVRMFGGTDFRATSLHVTSGDDALQFTPVATVGSVIRDLSISNAYYIGCTGIAKQGRSMIATLSMSPSGTGGLSASIKDVGFIACQGSGTTRAIVVSNVDSTGEINGVSFTDCTVDQSTDTYGGQEVYLQAATNGGRIRDIRFTRLHVISPNTTALSTQGDPNGGKWVESVTLTDCVFDAPRTAVGTIKPFAVDKLTIRGGRIEGNGGAHVIEGGTGVNAAKNIRMFGTRVTGVGNGFAGVRHAETAGYVVRDSVFERLAGATTSIGISVAATSSRGSQSGNDYSSIDTGVVGNVGSPAQVFNAQDFGAKGDGVTDDAAGISSAVTVCNALGGGDVLVPASANPYMLGTNIVMKSNVRLVLAGNLKVLASCTKMAISATNTNNIAIVGLPGGGVIDMNKAQTANRALTTDQQGIYAAYTNAVAYSGLTVTGVTIKNCWMRGFSISSVAAGSSISNVLVENNTLTDCPDIAFYDICIGNSDKTTASPSQNHVIRNNTITFPTVAGITGILVGGQSYLYVKDNVLDGGGLATSHGICIGTTGTARHCTDFYVTRNMVRRFSAGAQWGICLTLNGTRFHVNDNQCVSNYGGITVDLEDGAAQNVEVNAAGIVKGNRCTGSTGSHGINSRMLNNLTIANNRCTNGAAGGIYVSVETNVTVVGNTCMNNTSRGIGVFGSTGGFHRISANHCRLNTGGDFYIDPLTPNPVRGDFEMAGVPALNAAPGSTYLRTDGGAGTSLYVKETASSSAVWAAK